jgi:peptidoglycan/xylan/chitin deacetylase (PgdA/CDA1 family)
VARRIISGLIGMAIVALLGAALVALTHRHAGTHKVTSTAAAPSGPLPAAGAPELITIGRPGGTVSRAPVIDGRGVERNGVIHTVAPAAGSADVVALTFDDGPDPKWTPQVLQILDDAGIHATFCLVGRNVRRHPDLVRSIRDAGDAVCDHTENHVEHLDRRPLPIIDAEISLGAADIAAVLGSPPRLYRPPGGSLSPTVINTARAHGMGVLAWSIDPRDWKRGSPDSIFDYIVGSVKPGAVILLHDGGGDRSATVAMLPRLIGELTRRGYRFTMPG